MLDNLSDKLGSIVKNLKGNARITEDNVKDTLREVRLALLDADVSFSIVKEFISNVKEKALGKDVIGSLTPGQAFIDVVNNELVGLMGSENHSLNLATIPPAVILMAGLQGSGKTTTAAKLAYNLKKDTKKKILLVSTDVYRPAAIEQLSILAKQIGVSFFESNTNQKPEDIASNALLFAKKNYFDVLIVDSAGRLAIDDIMMNEITNIHKILNPIETLFIADSMLGQDAVNTAKAFNDSLELTGVILTKMDGDTRGGASLSIRKVTGKPIKFIGVGEKIDALEAFYPDRLASRILGMGDILSLIDDVKKSIDIKSAEKVAKKIKKGKSFDLNDFKEQLQQMKNMGGVGSLLEKMPGQIASQIPEGFADKAMVQVEAIINSMTPKERVNPQILKASRKRRIALGAGVEVQEVNKLLKQFEQSQKMMKSLSKGGLGKMLKMMPGIKNMMPR